MHIHENSPVLAVDTETTGVDHLAKVVELGVIVRTATQIKSFNSICNPKMPISIAAMSVHNITDEDAALYPDMTEVLGYTVLSSYNQPNAILLGHNIDHDLKCILNSDPSFVNNYTVIDTYKIAYELLDDSPNHKLNFLRYHLNINDKVLQILNKLSITSTTHRADYDAAITLALYDYLRTICSLEQMVEISSKPILYKKFTYGKYENVSYEEVAKTNYQYLQWFLNAEIEKLDKKNVSIEDRRTNTLLITLLYYLDKYKPVKSES